MHPLRRQRHRRDSASTLVHALRTQRSRAHQHVVHNLCGQPRSLSAAGGVADGTRCADASPPGTGKSTLLNGIFGETRFEAGRATKGPNAGLGITTKVQREWLSASVCYGDTPGLDDVRKRKEAAAAIEQALRQNGDYRLIFVVALRAGRVQPADALTVRYVLEAVGVDVPFAIVINMVWEAARRCGLVLTRKQLAQEEYDDLDTPAVQQAIMAGILSGTNRSTHYFHSIALDPDLNGKDMAMPRAEVVRDLKAFLATVPFVQVRSADVSALKDDAAEFEKLRAQFDEEIKRLNEEQAYREQVWEKRMLDAQAEHRAQLEHFQREQARREEEWEQRRQEADDAFRAELARHQAGSQAHAAEMERHRVQMAAMQQELTALRARQAPPAPAPPRRRGGLCSIQ